MYVFHQKSFLFFITQHSVSLTCPRGFLPLCVSWVKTIFKWVQKILRGFVIYLRGSNSFTWVRKNLVGKIFFFITTFEIISIVGNDNMSALLTLDKVYQLCWILWCIFLCNPLKVFIIIKNTISKVWCIKIFLWHKTAFVQF